jgi:hypothetical protein
MSRECVCSVFSLSDLCSVLLCFSTSTSFVEGRHPQICPVMSGWGPHLGRNMSVPSSRGPPCRSFQQRTTMPVGPIAETPLSLLGSPLGSCHFPWKSSALWGLLEAIVHSSSLHSFPLTVHRTHQYFPIPSSFLSWHSTVGRAFSSLPCINFFLLFFSA